MSKHKKPKEKKEKTPPTKKQQRDKRKDQARKVKLVKKARKKAVIDRKSKKKDDYYVINNENIQYAFVNEKNGYTAYRATVKIGDYEHDNIEIVLDDTDKVVSTNINSFWRTL